MFYSCWYLAYILFDLEERYGQTFTVQMGAPTDSGHLRDAKRTAVRILGSAYNLVENVFKNDKAAFLATDIYKLEEMTTILPYSKALKEDCGILVFPEAYACLKPLTSIGRIAEGMNLMVDIGGGTTDISFFTIEPEDEENKSKVKIPQVYDFLSIDKGLNFLTMARADDKRDDSDSNVKSSREINEKRLYQYRKEMDSVCRNLILRLHTEFHQQSSLSASALENALKNRPIIYCGGGSTFKILRKKYANFSECLQVSEQEWDRKSVVDMDEIIRLGLCPILSTAYGLSIHAKSDSIKCKPFKDIFDKDGLRNKTQGYNSYNNDNHYRSVYDDWDAIK